MTPRLIKSRSPASAILVAFLFASFAYDASADAQTQAQTQTEPQQQPQTQTQSAKRPLDHADFDAWRGIATPVLSRDGKWLAYSMQPQDGDGELVIRELVTGKERRETIGALPPPVLIPNEENPDAPPVPRVVRVLFSSDSRYLITSTYPSKAETIAARKAKKKADEMPKGGMLIINLTGSNVVRVANVKSMQVPSKGGAWVAYLKEDAKVDANADAANTNAAVPAEAKAADDDDDDDQAAARAAATTGAATPPISTAVGAKKVYGTYLVLRELSSGFERVFANVLENSFARDGKTLLFTVASKTEADNGVYALATGEAVAPVALLSGKGKYLKLTWDREQSQLAFLSDRDDVAAKVPQFKLYHWLRASAAAAGEAVSAGTPGVPPGMAISEKGPATTVAFSRDGKKLYVPMAAPAKAARAADAAPLDEDKVSADLWRWNDDVVQSIQKVRATQELNRSYRGVFDLAARRYTQLADVSLRSIALSDDGKRALGVDDRAYRRMTDYDGAYADVYVVDTATGARKLAIKQLRDGGGAGSGGAQFVQAQWSPDGNWAYYYQAKHWHVLNTADGRSRNLTAALGVAVHNELHDLPQPAGAYGVAGWMSDSQSLLIYDRYDVWQLFVDGRPPTNLSRGEGRKAKIQLRVQRTEPVDEDDEERGFDAGKALVLRGESEIARATGFYKTSFAGSAAPQRLTWGEQNFRYIGRAQQADVLLVSASRFDLYPDLYTTDANFAALTKVTDGGAQMAPFLWGKAELMGFNNRKGVPLQAALYKPANFDARKKYPLIVYIYERLSQNVHNFNNPAPGHNIDFSQYVSNGYLVMTPDIAYTTGYPGKSAMDAVMPAIDALVKQGYVDEKAIGIQGHSWGGYQIAYMLTKTNRFRAAEAGAPVGNMTSAYSGIRWGTGLPRQFQYEQSQSRIGKPLQEATALFIENSPIFQAQKVTTPLLIMANDNDDAVPWYQGIELFLALRRYQKEVYFFNYNGEFHGLRRRADQKDYARRMSQFFDHYLKGAAAPEWMDKGIPYIERDEEKEKFSAIKLEAAGGK